MSNPLRDYLTEDPDYTYGSVLPLRRKQEVVNNRIESGRMEWALPKSLRNILLGAIDLTDPESQSRMARDKKLTPNALEALFGTATGIGGAAKNFARKSPYKVYHGTMSPDEAPDYMRNPGTHFGPAGAADDRLYDLIQGDIRTNPNTGKMYRRTPWEKVGLESSTRSENGEFPHTAAQVFQSFEHNRPAVFPARLVGKKVAVLDDLGGWDDDDVWLELIRKGYASETDRSKGSLGGPLKFLREKGYDTIKYVNQHEAQGQHSFINLSPGSFVEGHK